MKLNKLLPLTCMAMVAFASNSILCRLALKQTRIDPATFTFVRLFSGAVALWLLTTFRNAPLKKAGNWLSALALFAYAAAFSFAYLELSAGTGALLLFGAVQATMIFWGLLKGERLHPRQVMGLAAALGGLVLLLFPGLSAPPFLSAALMLGAGIAWGVYSLRGKTVGNPAGATAGNFLGAVPFSAALAIFFFHSLRFHWLGITYAILSGAVTSGLGYIIWYSVLPSLKATSAATVQLSVPVLTATGGILLLGEPLTARYLTASIAILGGIAMVVIKRNLLCK